MSVISFRIESTDTSLNKLLLSTGLELVQSRALEIS
jgi:hypothetical protein